MTTPRPARIPAATPALRVVADFHDETTRQPYWGERGWLVRATDGRLGFVLHCDPPGGSRVFPLPLRDVEVRCENTLEVLVCTEEDRITLDRFDATHKETTP